MNTSKTLFRSLYFLFLGLVFAQAQMADPVKWSTRVEKNSETEYTLHYEVKIDSFWHMYSQFTPDGGPLPTEYDYQNQKGNYQLIGKTVESPYNKVFNDIFGVDEYYFADKASFYQKIKVLNANVKSIPVEVSYQACKEQCIQLYKKFDFVLPALNKEAFVASPNASEIELEQASNDTINEVLSIENNTAEKSSTTNTVVPEEKNLWSIFLVAFLFGFTALLTPCVFPMIPLTVSFFTKQSQNRAKGIRNAIFYGASIVIIYVTLGTVIVAIFGADSLNEMSTSVFFNLLFFAILIVFAISFLGAFEIVLPQSWANKIDGQSNRSGIVGIFFMALALAIVSFSCTGPIVGTLLVEASSKGGIAPIVGMLGFSLAIALPFMLFALFPGWLNSLPKSGGWMQTVKVSLGFLELALAFKFLSKADLVSQTHLLEREVFLAIWIAVFGAWAMYLFGRITLNYDNPNAPIGTGRLLMALLVSSFTIYLIPGLWGAPLKIISGFPPPLYYSESPQGVGGSGGNVEKAVSVEGNYKTKVISHGLTAFLDYEEGLAYAKKVNKPVLLDFTGHGCENCRKMEDFVWSDPKVLQMLREQVVLVSLYVDEKEKLPESKQYVSKTTGRTIKSVGNLWSDFQIEKYQTNSQPYYLVLDTEGRTISKGPRTYNADISYFRDWLKDGIANFTK